MRPLFKNLLLTVASVVFLLLLLVAADRIFGRYAPDPRLPGSMELIFPPRSEQTFETTEFHYTAHINSLGLRDRELPAHPGAYRIAVIGDSYTYGWGVESEQTWVRLVEDKLRAEGYDVELINLGKPGSGPPFYAELAEKAIPVLHPDLVIVAMLQGNDLGAAGPEPPPPFQTTMLDRLRVLFPNTIRVLQDMRRNRNFAGRTDREMPPQKTSGEDNRRWAANTAREFQEKMSPEERARFDALEDTVKQAFLSGNLNPFLIDLALKNPQFYCLTMDVENDWTKTCIRNTAGQLERIRAVAGVNDARVLVTSIPEGSYVNEDALRNIRRVGYEVPDAVIDKDAPDEGIRRACEMAGLPFINVTDAFKARRTETGLFYELDGHLTAAGHQVYADTLAPRFLEACGAALPRIR